MISISKLWPLLSNYGGLKRRVPLTGSALIGLGALFEAGALAGVVTMLAFLQDGGQALASQSFSLRNVFDWAGLEFELTSIAGWIVVFFLLREAISFRLTLYFGKATTDLEAALKNRLSSAMLKSRYTSLHTLPVGNYLNTLTSLTFQASQLVPSLSQILSSFVTITTYVALLFYTSPLMALFGAFGVLIIITALSFIVRRVQRLSSLAVSTQGDYGAAANRMYVSARLIKLAGAEPKEIEDSKAEANKLADQRYQVTIAGAGTRAILTIAIIVLLMSGALFFEQRQTLDLAQFTTVLIVALRVMPLALGFTRLRQGVANRLPSLEKVVQTIDYLEGLGEKIDEGESYKRPQKTISFSNVSVRYGENTPEVLKNVSLEVPIGKMIALVGASGAGKSTFMDLLPRVITPTSGQIYFDDLPLDQFKNSELRADISAMPQNALLYGQTVREAVSYFDPQASMERVKTACQQANASEFIEQMPLGYDAPIGEQGEQLSGGQRQRLALARALLPNTHFLLLDEPTSAIDSVSEAYIRASIEAEAKRGKRSIFIIAHRMETIRAADYVVCLKNGEVAHITTGEGATDLKEMQNFLEDQH